MSTKLEEECLSLILAKNLHSILLGYFTLPELQVCICEEEWEGKIIKEFGNLLHYSQGRGGHETWYEYYCYLYDLVHKRATVITLDNNITSDLYLTYKAYFDEGKRLSERMWKKVLSLDLYSLVKDLCYGDIIICGTCYLIIGNPKAYKDKYIHFKKAKSNKEPIHLFTLIGRLSINYWNNYNIPQLEMGVIYILNCDNYSQLCYNVSGIADVGKMYIILKRGVAYALFLHRKDVSFEEEKYNTYSVAPIRNYMKYVDTLNGVAIYSKSKESKPSSTQSILHYHNVGWDRVFITWQHLLRLHGNSTMID